MENYELITLKSCRGCLREVLLLDILQRLWPMRGGRTRRFDCINQKNFSNFEHPV